MRHPSNMASRASRLPRVDRQPVLHLEQQLQLFSHDEQFTASTRPANQHWLCFGCLSAASLATFSWRFNLPVASVRLSRSRAKRRLGNRRRDRGAERCLASNPPERLDHAQPPAASLKLNHAIGVGPGLGQSFRRRRPPHCAERRVPIRGVTSGSPAPFTLRHGAKQLTRFTTARPASPAPLAGSRCSRPSPRPAALACGPGRPCAAAPACAPAAPPAPGASCPGSGLLERRDTRAVARLASLGDRPRVLKRLIACLG